MTGAWLVWAAVAAAAGAPEVRLYLPDGAPVVGMPAEVEVAVAVDGRPVERAQVELAAEAGTVGMGAPAGPGRWRWPYTAGAGSDTLRVRVDGGAWSSIGVVAAASVGGRVQDAAPVEEAVGTEVLFRFPVAAAVSVDDLVVRVSEGTVRAVEADAREVRVRVAPGPDRNARVLAVALADRGQPGGGAAFGVARLRARQSAALNVGAGSTVLIRVGRRSYGPFAADPTGVAHVSFDVLPGETRFDIVASDDLGNSQKVQSPLPANLAPVLVGVDMAAGRLAGARLTLGVWTAAGVPWTGDAPGCRGPVGESLPSRPLASGVWSVDAALPAELVSTAFDLRVDCVVADASARFRIPLADPAPARIELRAYPDTLASDYPVAQLQAQLLDTRGDRLPVDGLELRAALGHLEAVRADGVLRADYRGEAAVAAGADTITAEWRAAPGHGAVWALDLVGGAVSTGIEVRARALDVRGLPIPGVAVTGEVEGAAFAAVTDAAGRAVVVVPRPAGALWTLRARAGGVERATAVYAAGPGPLPDAAAPDLVASLTLPIRSGRVRRMQLDVAPRPLVTGSGERAVVTVRMLDAAGAPVRDEQVSLSADSGTMSPGTARPDGAVQAVYTPPPGSLSRTVTITATTSSGTVDTELELVPRPVVGSVALDVGWLTNLGRVSSPSFAVAAENAVPFLPGSLRDVLRTRVGVDTHALAATVNDPVSGLQVDVAARFFPVTLGVVAGTRTGHRVFEVGVSGVLAPYTLRADFDGVSGVSGVGLASPGVQLLAGGGWRSGISEVYAEGRYLFLTAPRGTVTFEGTVGGASLSVGYRVLY